MVKTVVLVGFSVWAFCISLYIKPLFVAQVKDLENNMLKTCYGRGEVGPAEASGADCTFLQDAELFQLSLFQKVEWSQGSVMLAFLLSLS